MKVGLYARVSTNRQDLSSQCDQLMNWANLHKYEYVVFKDFAVSGRRDSRKGINALRKAAADGEIDAVAVVEISRIGRSMKFIYEFIEEMNKLHVKLYLSQSNMLIDYESTSGRATIGAFALAADIEWQLIKERNKRSRETIKKNGIKVGRKHKPVSYDAAVLLQQQGKSYREIGLELNCSAATVMRVLKSR